MKKPLRLIMLILLIPGMLFAAEPYYDAGSQMFNITAGATVPFFYHNPSRNDQGYQGPEWTFWPGDGADRTHRTVGGVGTISYQVFLHPYIALGGELGFQFDFARSGIVGTNVPIFVKATAIPVQGTVELPISIGAGLLYASYDGSSKITFGCEAEIGVRYFITDSWGVGINVGIYIFPELYASAPAKMSTLSYIPATLTVTYRH